MTIVAGTGITYGVLCAAAATAFVYVLDCYRPIASEVCTIVVAFRNTFAFGLSFAVIPWVQKDGFIKVTNAPLAGHCRISHSREQRQVSGYMTLIEGLIFVLAVPMYILGPRCRHWTSKFAI